MTLQIDGTRERRFKLALTVGEAAEQCDAIGFGPKAQHASIREGRILDRE